jgi:hypothetical protein
MQRSKLDNLINDLRSKPIQDIECYDRFSYDKVFNYLTSIGVDATQNGTVERAKKLISSQLTIKKMSRKMPAPTQFFQSTGTTSLKKY